MSPDEAAKARADLSAALLVAAEQCAPIFDAADGVRADLERRGWSPTAAEQVGLQWLVGAMATVWRAA